MTGKTVGTKFCNIWEGGGGGGGGYNSVNTFFTILVRTQKEDMSPELVTGTTFSPLGPIPLCEIVIYTHTQFDQKSICSWDPDVGPCNLFTLV